jgi:hypothetical protein
MIHPMNDQLAIVAGTGGDAFVVDVVQTNLIKKVQGH